MKGLILIFLTTFSLMNCYSQIKNTKIILKVDTDNVREWRTRRFVSIEDSNGNSEPIGGKINQFTTEIDSTSTITWVGESLTNKNHQVDIVRVWRKTFRGRKLLKIEDVGGVDGQVTANAIDKYLEGRFAYRVRFKVSNKNRSYGVDPRLKLRRPPTK